MGTLTRIDDFMNPRIPDPDDPEGAALISFSEERLARAWVEAVGPMRPVMAAMSERGPALGNLSFAATAGRTASDLREMAKRLEDAGFTVDSSPLAATLIPLANAHDHLARALRIPASQLALALSEFANATEEVNVIMERVSGIIDAL